MICGYINTPGCCTKAAKEEKSLPPGPYLPRKILKPTVVVLHGIFYKGRK
jgi:hypothetical protein